MGDDKAKVGGRGRRAGDMAGTVRKLSRSRFRLLSVAGCHEVEGNGMCNGAATKARVDAGIIDNAVGVYCEVVSR